MYSKRTKLLTIWVNLPLAIPENPYVAGIIGNYKIRKTVVIEINRLKTVNAIFIRKRFERQIFSAEAAFVIFILADANFAFAATFF